MRWKRKTILPLTRWGVLLIILMLTSASISAAGSGTASSFTKDEINLFKRIAAHDNARDPDSGPPFIYSARYQWTPDHAGKIMLFEKDEIADYPNGYRVVYYPENGTILFTWDAGQADRGCCTYVVLDRLLIKTITAGGLSIRYEKVYHNGVPVYYKVTQTDLPTGGNESKISRADLIGKWILTPDKMLNFRANGVFCK